jgi:hypothetical protein
MIAWLRLSGSSSAATHSDALWRRCFAQNERAGGRKPAGPLGRERQWAWFAMSVAHGARSRATQLRRAVCSGPATRVRARTRSPRSPTPREAPALSLARLSNDRALRLPDCWSARRTLNCGARRNTAACRSSQRCALLPSGVPTSFQTVSVGAAAADAVAGGPWRRPVGVVAPIVSGE